jgi:hypothetical protein
VAVIKFSSEALVSGETRRLVACFQICLVLLAALAILLLVLPTRFVFTNFTPRYPELVLGAAGVALQALSAAMLTGAQMQRAFFAGSVASTAALAIGTGAAVMFRRLDLAIWATVLMYLVQVLVQVAASQRRLRLRSADFLRFDRSAMSAVVGVVGAIAISSQIVSVVPWLVSRWLIANDSTLVAAAVFAASLNIFGLVLVVSGRAVQIGFVRQLESARSGYRHLIVREDLYLSALCGGSALLCFAAFAIGRNWLVSQYGPQIGLHQGAVLAFAFAGIPAALYSVLGNRIVAHDGQWAWLGVTVVWTITILGLISGGNFDPIWAPALAYNSAYCAALAAGGTIYVMRLLRSVPRE